MAKPIFVVTADTHLRPYAWAKYPGIAGDSYFALDQIYRYAIEHDLPVILAGDVFDVNYPDSRSVYAAIYAIEALMERMSKPTWFIQGQHEYAPIPWLDCARGSVHSHKLKWTAGNICFYGLDFTKADRIQDELVKIPSDTQVLIAHQVWEEQMGYIGTIRVQPPEAAIRDVPHVRCVITGDFHGHKMTTLKGANGQDILVVSPGSTCLQSIDEDANKYFYVMYDDFTFQSVPLLSRPVIRSRFGTKEALREVAEDPTTMLAEIRSRALEAGLPDYLVRPIWYVEYYDTIDGALALLQQVAGDQVHLMEKPLRARTVNDPGNGQATNLADGLRRGLESCLEMVTAPDGEVYRTCRRLLQSNDRKAEVRQVVEEFQSDAADVWADGRSRKEAADEKRQEGCRGQNGPFDEVCQRATGPLQDPPG